jgi:hypothetical protein
MALNIVVPRYKDVGRSRAFACVTSLSHGGFVDGTVCRMLQLGLKGQLVVLMYKDKSWLGSVRLWQPIAGLLQL